MTTFYKQEEIIVLFDKVIAWAEARNLIKGATSQAQFMKLMEEKGEIAEGIIEGDDDKKKDGIGDVTVVLTILAKQNGLTMLECVDYAAADENPDNRIDILADTELAFSYYSSVLASGIGKKNLPKIKAAIGNLFIVTETISVEQFGFGCMLECLEISYNEIKDRKGKMIDGVFVKEADFHLMGITE